MALKDSQNKEILFYGKTFTSEKQRNKYCYENKETMISSREWPIAVMGCFLGFFIGLFLTLSSGTESSFYFYGSIVITPLIFYLYSMNTKKEIENYSEIYEKSLEQKQKKLVDIAKRYNYLITKFRQKYEDYDSQAERLPDLVSLINSKLKNFLIEEEDGEKLLELSRKEHNFPLIKERIKSLKRKDTKNLAMLFVDLYNTTDLEDIDDLEDNSDLNQFLDCLRDLKLNYISEDIKEEILSYTRFLKTENFEKKLCNNEDKTSITNLDEFEFEKWVEKQFKKAGYSTRLTKKSGDQGADVIAQKNGISTAIQVKKYSGAVGNFAVQEVVASKKYYDCEEAMVITTGYFTNSAYALAKKNKVIMIDGKKIEDFFESLN